MLTNPSGRSWCLSTRSIRQSGISGSETIGGAHSVILGRFRYCTRDFAPSEFCTYVHSRVVIALMLLHLSERRYIESDRMRWDALYNTDRTLRSIGQGMH